MKASIGIGGALLALVLLVSYLNRSQSHVETRPSESTPQTRPIKEPSSPPRRAESKHDPPAPSAPPKQNETLVSPLLPRSLEEARRDPNFEKNIRYYEDSIQRWAPARLQLVRVMVDDDIRMTLEVDQCMGGRVSSGYVGTTIYFDPVAGSSSEMWVDDIKVFKSNLDPEELRFALDCLQSHVWHRRRPTSTENERTNGFFENYTFAWPVEQSDVFLFLQTGNWPDYAPTPAP